MIADLAAALSVLQDDASDDMVTIFRRPEFDRSPGWWERTWESITDAFDGLSFSWLGPVGQFLLWLLLIVVVVAIVVTAWRLWTGRGPRRRKKRHDSGDVVPIDLDDLTDPAEIAARRAAFEQARDYKQAILFRYREAVLTLMQRRLVSTEPGRTTGELRIDVASTRPDLGAVFDSASTIFELAWYSDHGSTADEFHELDRHVTSVIAAVTEQQVPA